jgi:prolipoprotein diacylglyceryltransferase
MVMKRFVKALGNIFVCIVLVLYTTCWISSAFVELPPKENYSVEWYGIALLVLIVLATIYTVWRLLKFIVYQLVFTVTKAICEAKKHKI